MGCCQSSAKSKIYSHKYIKRKKRSQINNLLIYFKNDGSDGKASACNVGDPGSIPGSGRSPGAGNGNPLQCSCLENPMDGRSLIGYSPWGLKESDTTEQLHFYFHTSRNKEQRKPKHNRYIKIIIKFKVEIDKISNREI